MKKIILASIALISLGALSWLYGKSPIEEAMVTIQTADDKEIHIKKETALLIPLIKNMFKNIGDTAYIPLPNVSTQEFTTIVSILEKIQAPEFKRPKDGGYIAQKIQPIIDADLNNKSIEDINKIIAASNFLNLPYIVNGAIRVITQKMRKENPDISVNKIIATIYPVFGGIKEALGITKHLLPLYKKQYYLIKNGDIPELSVADYIVIHSMPKIETFYDEQDNPIHSLSLVQKGLTSLEGILQIDNISSVQDLSLYNNQLKTLPPGIFNDLSQLQELYLDGNPLSSLPPGIFNGLSRLQVLFLNNNQLSSLPPGIFNGLSQLQRLYLHDNKLSSLPPGIFNGLSQLEALYLDRNQLSSLPPGIFNGLSRLQELYLDNNPLSSLPAGTFNGLSLLQRRYLHKNKFNMRIEQIKTQNPQLPQNVRISL